MAKVILPKEVLLRCELLQVMKPSYIKKSEDRRRSRGVASNGISYQERYKKGDNTEKFIEEVLNVLSIENIKTESLSKADDDGIDFILPQEKALLQIKSSNCGLSNFYKKKYLYKYKVHGCYVNIEDHSSKRRIFNVLRDLFPINRHISINTQLMRFLDYLETKQDSYLNGKILRRFYGIDLINKAIHLGFLSPYSLDNQSYFVYPNEEYNLLMNTLNQLVA